MRELGDVRNTMALQRERMRVLNPLVRPTMPPLEHPTIVVEGVEYEVVWNGAMDGAAARGVPLAAQRGRADWPGLRGPRRGPLDY